MKESTRDHLVPVWAFMLLPEIPNGAHNVRPACESCNRRKSGMPPRIFMLVRNLPGEWKIQLRHWDRIRNQALSEPENQALLDYIFVHMTAPYPGKPQPKPRLPARKTPLLLPWLGLTAAPEPPQQTDPRWDKLRILIGR